MKSANYKGAAELRALAAALGATIEINQMGQDWWATLSGPKGPLYQGDVREAYAFLAGLRQGFKAGSKGEKLV